MKKIQAVTGMARSQRFSGSRSTPNMLGFPIIFCRNINLDDLVKSPLDRHPGGSRGPELLEITGFRLPPEGRKKTFSDFLRDHQT